MPSVGPERNRNGHTGSSVANAMLRLMNVRGLSLAVGSALFCPLLIMTAGGCGAQAGAAAPRTIPSAAISETIRRENNLPSMARIICLRTPECKNG